MNPSDIQAVLQWWIVILIIGIAFLPVGSLLFDKFFDKGYIFSKALGLAVVSYFVFLLGILHILPFTQLFSWLSLLIVGGIAFTITYRKATLLSVVRQNLPIFIFEELLFLAGLFFWAYIRSFSPDIHGLEKYMDFGFINSILRSEYFPPKDMWLTPYSINYYYFGHLTTAVLTKLSALPSNITFNLMLSTIFALCLTQAFSLGANLYSFLQKSEKISFIKIVASGILTAALVTLSGNLHLLYAFFKSYPGESPVPFWELPFLPFSFPNSYWYPNATRFIYNTIHEFPIYSWVVSDLHGHVLDIPFVLLTIAVLLSVFISKSEAQNPDLKWEVGNGKIENDARGTKKTKFSLHKFTLSPLTSHLSLALIGFLLAVMYMTNAWDGGIYLLLAALILFSIQYKSLNRYLLSLFTIGISLFVFSLPYNYFFKPFASGIGILCSPEFLTKIGKIGPFLFEKNYCQHSPWWQLLILYGFFYFFIISFMLFYFRLKKLHRSDTFVFLLIILSTFLIILPEFIYLKDIYPAHYRANTMFKLVFQSHIMLSISTGYIIVRIVSSIKYKVLSMKGKMLASCFLILASVLLALVLTYPYLATNSYYNLDQKDEKGQVKKPTGLDGTKYLQNLYPDDFKAIQWLIANVSGQPAILEAQSDSYTDYARVSANTGLPTVLGWTVHEWLWRGTYDIPSPRINEITTMYETTDVKIAKKLLEKHKVKYIFIGTLEYQKYPNLSEEKFKKLGTVSFSSGQTKIYEISP
jgi:uncharacterized membrane protein